MTRKFMALLLTAALGTSLLLAVATGQSKPRDKAPQTKQEPVCCCQGMMGGGRQRGMGMMGGMGPMRGRGMRMQGRGMMQGMQGRQGQMMGNMGGDMMTAHQLVMQHESVKRAVKQLPNGVETLTESDDPDVAAKIKEHVPAMYARLKENRPIHQIDPLFRELFRYGSKIKSEVTLTPKGVRVVETSADPYVVKLIKAHAKSVDELVKRGMDAMHEQHEVPNR
jgi:hypothetical protein